MATNIKIIDITEPSVRRISWEDNILDMDSDYSFLNSFLCDAILQAMKDEGYAEEYIEIYNLNAEELKHLNTAKYLNNRVQLNLERLLELAEDVMNSKAKIKEYKEYLAGQGTGLSLVVTIMSNKGFATNEDKQAMIKDFRRIFKKVKEIILIALETASSKDTYIYKQLSSTIQQ